MLKDGSIMVCVYYHINFLHYFISFQDTLANSYVCFYFMVENHPKNLKQAFSAYNLAVSFKIYF